MGVVLRVARDAATYPVSLIIVTLRMLAETTVRSNKRHSKNIAQR